MLLDVSGRELTSLAIPNVLAGLDKPDRNGPSSFQVHVFRGLSDVAWSGGIGPYFLSIHPTSGFDISNDQQFSNLSGDSMTWKANVPAGTQMVAELTDTGSGTGTNAKSQPFTVGQGPDDSCLQGPSSSASSTTTSIMNTTSTSNSSEERRPPDTTTTTSTQTTTTTSPNSSSPGQSPLSSSAQPGSSTSGSQDPAITADSTSSDTSSGTDTSPSSSAPVSPPSAATTDHKQTFGTAAIVGIAVGSAFALSSIILMLWWYIRRKPGPNVVSPYSDPAHAFTCYELRPLVARHIVGIWHLWHIAHYPRERIRRSHRPRWNSRASIIPECRGLPAGAYAIAIFNSRRDEERPIY
ncbi:hypothetical protein C8Q73DRAFT_661964 [Cubamyces lactineus]|nr:hypothetical protein C8Q73DRAFT_661964 [Cubamyces lactineus]